MKNRFLITVTFILVVVFCGLNSQKAAAQVDPHFSQYYANPLWLNPGLTGVMDGSFRISANYKRQWATVTNPYQTMALSFDSHPSNNNHLGYGASVLNQTAGDGGFNYMSVSGSAAYRLLIDRRKMNVLSIGIQAGIISRRFDPNKLKFGEQWNPVTGYDPGAVNGEMFDQTSSLDFDANIGIVYYNRNPNTSVNPFGGVSVYHLTRPYDPFYKHSDSRLPMRINLHGGARIKMGNRFVLTPQLIYLHQGKDFGNGRAHELVGSLYAQYMLGATADLLFGATYRLKDAAVPFVGFHVGDFTLGFSYDVNVSKLNVASLSQGGMEISLTFINHKEVYNTDFVCPRL